MLQDDIMANETRILSQTQRCEYFDQGYVVCSNFLDDHWLTRIRDAYARTIERSRTVSHSNEWFSLQTEHSAKTPLVLRVEKLADQDPEFWEFVLTSKIADLACDVLGPDVKYRDSMINVKPPGAKGRVAWHQDLPFYPHTNVGAIQTLIALFDISDELGPLTVIPGSHKAEIFEHYDALDHWTGEIKPSDLERVDLDSSVVLTMRAGDAVVLHPLTVHSSKANCSEDSRPLLIHGFDAADSISYTAMTWGNSHSGELVRGHPPRYAQHDGMRLRLPPDWSEGYTSIFEHQNSDSVTT